jgi:DNA-binding response OmpR family regulator
MPKVLIVDDDEDLRMVIADGLKHQKFLSEEVANGTEAKERLEASTYDLIILDWNLPDTPGIDVCRWFRSRGGSTPILMLTGRGVIGDKLTGFDAGADDYLTKPFEMRELIARLNALMRRGGMVAPTRALTLGALALDPPSHCATLDGKDIQLTPKEFDILEFFMRHPGHVFSAETILDRLWQNSTEVSPDIVRVYIKRLREKLDKHGRGSLIKNVHSVGYKLSPEGL